MTSLARQGISKEMYLQISGQDEEQMAHEAEEEAAKALRREAAIAAVVAAEKIEPTDEDVLAALEPTAERSKTKPEKLYKQLESNGRLGRLRAELANRQAVEWLVEHARRVGPDGGQDKPAAKKTAAKDKPAKKPAAEDKPAKKPAAEEKAPKETSSTEAAAEKPAAKKPAGKKPAAKKPAKPAE
jgi:trigger factor